MAATVWPQAQFLGAASAEAGLDIAFGHAVDVVLLDINLPGMDGYAALELLKAGARTAQVPVIALTANAMPDDVRRGHAAGFAAYLTKPLNMAVLISTVNALLAQSQIVTIPARRVLIVEGNLVDQEILRAMVDALGYELDIADAGAAALEALQKSSYAVVLMDCEMPHMSGCDATRAIRQFNGSLAQIPVIAVSAHAVAEQCAEAGMNDMLPKPVDVAHLKDILERYIPTAI